MQVDCGVVPVNYYVLLLDRSSVLFSFFLHVLCGSSRSPLAWGFDFLGASILNPHQNFTLNLRVVQNIRTGDHVQHY